MFVWCDFLILAEFFQSCSLVLLYRHNRLRKSIAGLSCDFTVYSWLAAVSSAGSGMVYMFLPVVQEQYSNRYPVYPDIRLNGFILVANLLLVMAASGIMGQVFVFYRKSITGDELISLPCKALLLCFTGLFFWLVSLFVRGRATINELDLADCLWTIGTMSFGVRLIPQVSNNFFLGSPALMHRYFTHLQSASMLFAISGWWLAKAINIPWFEKPVNAFSEFTIAPNIICLILLVIQGNKSRINRSYLPI